MRNHWGENWNMKNIPNFREMGKSKLGKKFRIIKKSPMISHFSALWLGNFLPFTISTQFLLLTLLPHWVIFLDYDWNPTDNLRHGCCLPCECTVDLCQILHILPRAFIVGQTSAIGEHIVAKRQDVLLLECMSNLLANEMYLEPDSNAGSDMAETMSPVSNKIVQALIDLSTRVQELVIFW